MTTNFYLDSKELANKERNLICFIRGIEKGKTTYINTGIRTNPELWNPQKQNFRRNHPNSMALNSYLDMLTNKTQSFYLEYSQKSNDFNLKSFKASLTEFLFSDNTKQKKQTFFEIYDIYLASKRISFSLGYIKKLKTLRAHLKYFELYSKYDLCFEKLDLTFFDKFNEYGLKSANLTNNTIGKLTKQFKSFLYWAHEHGYHNYLKFKNVKIKEEKVDIVYLTEIELLKLFHLDLSSNQRLSNVRDVFCLSCFTGVRFSDISSLDYVDIKNDAWFLRTQKTKDKLEIPLSNYALEILNKHINSGKKLPVITNQKSNQYLKELCKIAEINEPTKKVSYQGAERIEIVKPKNEFISTHAGRRTFVILSLEKGMRAETAMSITGHKDYKTFKKYILISSKVKHEEMRNIWNSKV